MQDNTSNEKQQWQLQRFNAELYIMAASNEDDKVSNTSYSSSLLTSRLDRLDPIREQLSVYVINMQLIKLKQSILKIVQVLFWICLSIRWTCLD